MIQSCAISKRRAKARRSETSVRVVGLDDWAWRKGSTYGTIIVDLERRQVINLMPDHTRSVTVPFLGLPNSDGHRRSSCSNG
jgi:transposase